MVVVTPAAYAGNAMRVAKPNPAREPLIALRDNKCPPPKRDGTEPDAVDESVLLAEALVRILICCLAPIEWKSLYPRIRSLGDSRRKLASLAHSG